MEITIKINGRMVSVEVSDEVAVYREQRRRRKKRRTPGTRDSPFGERRTYTSCPVPCALPGAVAAAAYRSGERLTNEWDGLTHDYTHKPGIVHKEIMLSDLGFENCSNAESYRGGLGCAAAPG